MSSRRGASDAPFLAALVALSAAYALLILVMLVADVSFTSPADVLAALESPEIRHAAKLSFVTATITAILCAWFAVAIGYLLARYRFRGKALLEALFNVPIVLPPMVVGSSLLILFQAPVGRAVEAFIPVTYRVPSIVLAQFTPLLQ